LALFASPAAQADIGPDLGDVFFAALGWPVAAALVFILATPGRRLAWALGVAAAYPLLFTAIVGVITRFNGTPFGASTPALLLQGACVAALAGWLMLQQVRSRHRYPDDNVHRPWSDCAAALLLLLALACMLTPQFIYSLPQVFDWQAFSGRWFAAGFVGAHLVAAWALWRRRSWARVAAAFVAMTDLGLSITKLDNPNDNVIAALWCLNATAALVALGIAAWLDHQNPTEEDSRPFGKLDVAWLLAILLVAPLGSPAYAMALWNNARAYSGALELRRERKVRAAALVTMQEQAKALAARQIANWQSRPRILFGRLQTGDLDTLPIALGGPTCDVRIWDAESGESWDAPRIAFRARITRKATGDWQARVGIVARNLESTHLQYGGRFTPGLEPNVRVHTKLTNEVRLPNDGMEIGGFRVRRLEVWPLLGARDEWTDLVENPGPAAYDLPTWTIPYLHVFEFEQVWPQADLEVLARDPKIKFLIAAANETQTTNWSAAVILRADGAMGAQFSDRYEPVSLLDATVAVRLREAIGVDEQGNTFAFAAFENLGNGRFSVVVNDPRVREAAAKIPTDRRGTLLVLRVEPGEVTERAGRLERAVLAPAVGPAARAGLTCDPRVPTWFVESFRVATSEGLEFPGRVK
jgi:hypothetical protein